MIYKNSIIFFISKFVQLILYVFCNEKYCVVTIWLGGLHILVPVDGNRQNNGGCPLIDRFL